MRTIEASTTLRALLALCLPATLLACGPVNLEELVKASQSASSGGGGSDSKPQPPPPPKPGDGKPLPPPPPPGDRSCSDRFPDDRGLLCTKCSDASVGTIECFDPKADGTDATCKEYERDGGRCTGCWSGVTGRLFKEVCTFGGAPPPPKPEPQPQPSPCKSTKEDGLACTVCPDGRDGETIGCSGPGAGTHEIVQGYHGTVCSAIADDAGAVVARKCHGTFPTKTPDPGVAACAAVTLDKQLDRVCTICLDDAGQELARSCGAGMEFLATRK